MVLAAAAPVEGGPGALGPRRWFTESARPHSAPKYVCYAPHSADPVSSLIRAGYLKGRRSGSPRPEPSGQRDIGIIVLADLLNGSQGGGGWWLRVQGRVRGHVALGTLKEAQHLPFPSHNYALRWLCQHMEKKLRHPTMHLCHLLLQMRIRDFSRHCPFRNPPNVLLFFPACVSEGER